MSISTVGQFVRERREALGTPRERLAAASGVSVSTIARLELNDQIPNARSLRRIASELDITIDSILDAPEAAK